MSCENKCLKIKIVFLICWDTSMYSAELWTKMKFWDQRWGTSVIAFHAQHDINKWELKDLVFQRTGLGVLESGNEFVRLLVKWLVD